MPLVADRSVCDPTWECFRWEDRSAYAKISRSRREKIGVLQTFRRKPGSRDRKMFFELFLLACLTRLRDRLVGLICHAIATIGRKVVEGRGHLMEAKEEFLEKKKWAMGRL